MIAANRRRVSKVITTPAPVRGLNYKDSLAAMQVGDALVLDNIICRPGFVEVRKGFITEVTGLVGDISTLMPYISTAGVLTLFSAANGAIYNTTASGAVGAALVSGLASNYWNQTQVSNVAGNFLFICNATDTERVYNGTTWAASGFTGPTAGTLSNVTVWKRRVWWVQKNSTKAWYGAADAISGAMTGFDLQGIFRRGGRLQAIIPWTIDGGEGVDDYLVFVSSMGEVAVYKGTDPASAATFALIGVYYVGAPIGERFWATIGGDLLLLTREGLIPFSKYLQSTAIDRTTFYTDRILQLISDDVIAYGNLIGWEVHVYFADSFLFLQVPAGDSASGARYQYAMNLVTGAWSRFLFGTATTWAVVGSALYLGLPTKRALAWNIGTDDGEVVSGVVVPAFNYFSTPGTQKRVNLSRVTIQTDALPTVQTLMLKNFDYSYSFGSSTSTIPSATAWDVALWDVGTWGATLKIQQKWVASGILGYSISQAIKITSSSMVNRLISIDYNYEAGGVL